ncbi:MAG TPA: hypothetical protein VEK34_12525 [Methylocella sp.]|nr:hypothetical protein [Methylocella sp.]
MRYFAFLGAWIWAVVIWACPAFADQDCSAILIKARTKVTPDVVTDLAIALNLSEDFWQEAQKDPHFDGFIRGIEAGPDFSRFLQNIESSARQYYLENFKERSFAMATIGLGTESLEAYKTCLWARQDELELIATSADATPYRLAVYYRPKSPGRRAAEITSLSNMSEESADTLRQMLKDAKFGSETVDLQADIVPQNPKLEIAIGIKVGDAPPRVLVFPPAYRFPKITSCTSQINDVCFRCEFGFDKKGIAGNPPNGPDDVVSGFCPRMPKGVQLTSEISFTLVKPGEQDCWFSAYLKGPNGRQQGVWTQYDQCSFTVSRYITRAARSLTPGYGIAELHIVRCQGLEDKSKNCEVKGHIDIFAPGGER